MGKCAEGIEGDFKGFINRITESYPHYPQEKVDFVDRICTTKISGWFAGEAAGKEKEKRVFEVSPFSPRKILTTAFWYGILSWRWNRSFFYA